MGSFIDKSACLQEYARLVTTWMAFHVCGEYLYQVIISSSIMNLFVEKTKKSLKLPWTDKPILRSSSYWESYLRYFPCLLCYILNINFKTFLMQLIAPKSGHDTSTKYLTKGSCLELIRFQKQAITMMHSISAGELFIVTYSRYIQWFWLIKQVSKRIGKILHMSKNYVGALWCF